jgi:hypothetical protein
MNQVQHKNIGITKRVIKCAMCNNECNVTLYYVFFTDRDNMLPSEIKSGGKYYTPPNMSETVCSPEHAIALVTKWVQEGKL